MSGEADPDLARVQQAARPIFAALGDDNRLRLVTRPYSEGPMSIVRLSHGSGLTRQAVTKHLRVQSARRGRESLWTLDPRPLDTARTSLDAAPRTTGFATVVKSLASPEQDTTAARAVGP
jgi:hypothetical protein